MKFRIRELAKERRMTMEDLAIKSGIKYSTVKNLWQGRTLDPSYSTIRALASALGVAVEQLEDREIAPGNLWPVMLQAA